MGLMVKGTRILVVDPPKSWLRVPQKVMPRNPDKLAYAKGIFPRPFDLSETEGCKLTSSNLRRECSKSENDLNCGRVNGNEKAMKNRY